MKRKPCARSLNSRERFSRADAAEERSPSGSARDVRGTQRRSSHSRLFGYFLAGCVGAHAGTFGLATDAEAKTKTASRDVLAAGTQAPDFRLRALDGTMIRLSEIAYPGKEKTYAPKQPVFLDFFRTDCEPCLKAMPELVSLHEKWASQGLKVILVSLLEESDGRAKLERFLTDKKLPFLVVVDSNQLFAKKYLGDVVTLPASFLIDREGVLKKAKYGATGTYEEYFGDEISRVLKAHANATSKGSTTGVDKKQ